MGVYATIGRLGRDAETRFTQGGTAVANFALAVDVGFGDSKSTLWLDCSLWGKRAEGGVVQYLTKGQQVYVTGEIATREYKKGNGEPGFAVTLRVDDLKLAGQANQQGGQNQAPQGGYSNQPQGGYTNSQQGGQPQQNQNPQQSRPPQGQQNQPPQNAPQNNYGAPDPGQFDDFSEEIPF